MPSEKDLSAGRLRRVATQALESLERAGVSSLPRPRPAAKGRAKTAAAGNAAASAASTADLAKTANAANAAKQSPIVVQPITSRSVTSQSTQSEPVLSPAASTGKLEQLDVLRGEVAACTLCAELASTRTQTVFGVGNPNARLCFFGEAPGADEDRLGEPFVGRAGQLLDKIIEACHLRREDVYICNVLRCRPPGNRTPAPDEVTNCRQHFQRQLAIIRPEFVCCLGTVAAQALLESSETIGRLRKKFFERDGMRILCTYHPAYLLRNPAAKRDVWDDMKLLMAEMGVTL
jgi:DNA polymerase